MTAAKSLSVTILKNQNSENLKPIPDFADEVNEIIRRLEDLFFVKKKRYVNPGITEAGKYVMDDIGQSTFARKNILNISISR
jgi:hypothetical protein